MAIPESELLLIRNWAEGLGNTEDLRFEIDVEGRSAIVLECRPPWNLAGGTDWTRQEMAKLTFTASSGTWQLYCSRGNGKWERYDGLGPVPRVDTLLREIDRDPTGIFKG